MPVVTVSMVYGKLTSKSNSYEFILDPKDTGYNGRATFALTRCFISDNLVRNFFWKYAEDIAQNHGFSLGEVLLGMCGLSRENLL